MNRFKKLGRLFENTYLGLMLAFFYAPILMLAVFSFSASRSRASWGGFTLHWYKELFGQADIMQALYNTLLVAVLSSLIATALGTLAAIGLYGMRRNTRLALLNLTNLPVINSEIVTGISLMILYTFMRLRLGLLTMLLSHIVFNVPYVILSVMPKLTQLDKHAYEAALDLGAPPGIALRRVILPEIMPGVITGLILAFTLSIDDFVISFFTTSGVQNLSIYIFSAARRNINPTLYALMTLMFITVLALLLVVNLRAGKAARAQTARLRAQAGRPHGAV